MTIPTLHVPQKDSPQSALAAGINDTETVLTLNDSSIFEMDNITRLTIGIDQSATEVITISSYDGNNEITVVRGIPAYSWPLGTLVARVLNADDITEIHQYLEDLHTTLSDGSTVTNGDSHDHSGGDGAVIPEGGIATGAVTADKIATGAVTADKIGTGAVTSSKLVSDAVDGSKIADNSINSEHIYSGAINTIHIANEQITTLKLATSSVIEGKIATGAVTTNKIANGAVTTDKIATSSISESKLSFNLPKSAADGRLTLESGVPVSLSDQADKTMLYYTPYIGNTIALYDGSSTWSLMTFAELSLNISGFTASKPYDIFCYNNSGTATLEGLVWTNATTRTTALTRQDGVLVKTGATTRRYLGTIYMEADQKCDDSEIYRNVWNMYNRQPRRVKLFNDNNHSYNGSIRKWANSDTNNLAKFVLGQSEYVQLNINMVLKSGASGSFAITRVYVDGDTESDLNASDQIQNYTGQHIQFGNSWVRNLSNGAHYAQIYEWSNHSSSYFYNFTLDFNLIA